MSHLRPNSHLPPKEEMTTKCQFSYLKEENQFTKTESIQESPWFTEKEHLQKNILLPTGIYRFLLAKGFSQNAVSSEKFHS